MQYCVRASFSTTWCGLSAPSHSNQPGAHARQLINGEFFYNDMIYELYGHSSKVYQVVRLFWQLQRYDSCCGAIFSECSNVHDEKFRDTR